MGWEVGQGKMKYLQISCSYVLKSTRYLGLGVSAVGLDLSSPHSCIFATIGNNWMTLPASPHPAPNNAIPQASTLPLPTTILLGTGAVVLGMQ